MTVKPPFKETVQISECFQLKPHTEGMMLDGHPLNADPLHLNSYLINIPHSLCIEHQPLSISHLVSRHRDVTILQPPFPNIGWVVMFDFQILVVEWLLIIIRTQNDQEGDEGEDQKEGSSTTLRRREEDERVGIHCIAH